MTLVGRIRQVLGRPGSHTAALLTGDAHEITGSGGLVPAAVLMAIVDGPQPKLVLTRRTDTLSNHAGQIAFPGGRGEAGDAGPVDTALREAWEEVRLLPSQVDVIGILDHYQTITGFRVTPIVGIIPPGLVLQPDESEVAAIIEAPLDVMLDPANHIEQAVEWQGHDRHYYEIAWDGARVWGATAGMIVNLSRRLYYEP